jgi:hypothetical protein
VRSERAEKESQQEALLPQKIFFLVFLRANRTTRKTADSELRQTITTIMVLAAFPLATETQARLEENQPSREAEPVTNATPEHTPFVELRQFAVRKILARNPQIAC